MNGGPGSVERWAREYGVAGRRGLERVFRDYQVRDPHKIYQWLRLASVIEFAGRQRTRPRRDELAELFGYGSGDYLGKRAKALTGTSLGQLIDAGLDAFFSSMRRRLSVGV